MAIREKEEEDLAKRIEKTNKELKGRNYTFDYTGRVIYQEKARPENFPKPSLPMKYAMCVNFIDTNNLRLTIIRL
jgi:hypothetical protein